MARRTGKRSKRKTPQSQQELQDMYMTPEHHETPGTRQRRRESRKKARRLFTATATQEIMRNLNMDEATEETTHEFSNEESNHQLQAVSQQTNATYISLETIDDRYRTPATAEDPRDRKQRRKNRRRATERYQQRLQARELFVQEEKEESKREDEDHHYGFYEEDQQEDEEEEHVQLLDDAAVLSSNTWVTPDEDPNVNGLVALLNDNLPIGLSNHEQHNESKIPGYRHRLAKMDVECPHCHAIKWSDETEKSCCVGGAVQLAPFQAPPEYFQTLLRRPDFMKNIRAYNNLFAFTSIGSSCSKELGLDRSLANSRDGVYTFRVQGAICHRIGSLLPPDGMEPKFAQLYVFDTDMEAQLRKRTGIFDDLDPVMIEGLQQVLYELNPYVHQFKTAGEYAQRSENVSLAIRQTVDVDLRTHNRPTASEVAAVLINAEEGSERDLILHLRRGGLTKLRETWASYDPLQYPLLFPRGELGWSLDTSYREEIRRNGNRRVSPREYYAYRLFTRPNDFCYLHKAGRLFQQYVVDQYAKIEEQRLRYQRSHQSDLRAELYAGLHDMVQHEGQQALARTGKRIILAPSFTGGERFMKKQYQDAMAIVRAFGKPDLFITMTCNPNWPEITENLLHGQKADDRPDLVTRVFRLKLKALLHDITVNHIFGKVIGRVHVIEFQKRGLPHAHILLMLEDGHKPRTHQDYDLFVSAEIPNPHTQPLLYETVMRHMIHGPCGNSNPRAPCMKDGVCSKGFPKSYCTNTTTNGDGYPKYRRRRDTTHTSQYQTRNIGNEWVVPYNPYLLQKYNCHINVEICSTVSAIKYLYKYVYKGHDRASIAVESDRDEIQEYLDARYISASESCWRIFDFPLQGRSHSVEQLTIHLPNSAFVTFRPTDPAEDVLERGRKSKLTEFFQLCQNDELASTLLYHDIPKHYVWRQKKWHPRRSGGNRVIGRMVSVSPMDVERYNLRRLLCHRCGPKSFEDLKTVDGVVYDTFKEAALAAGLLENDNEWQRCLEEAAFFQMPCQLRQLFVTILCYCQPSNARQLYDSFLKYFVEDFLRQHEHEMATTTEENNPSIIFKLLQDLNSGLMANSKSLKDYPTLPQLQDYCAYQQDPSTSNSYAHVRQERSYQVNYLDEILAKNSYLNHDQRVVYEKVLHAVHTSTHRNRYFFLDGPGGTGKSFVLEQILAKVRRENRIAIAVASSGIASLLLMGGRTAHSRFKLPLELTQTSSCSISKQSAHAKLLQEADMIVWDEAPMLHKYAFEAVDRCLQDLMSNELPFGGKCVLLAGDFRQILPVIPRANDAQIVSACLKRSCLWKHVEMLHLKENMRVRSARTRSVTREVQSFANFLLQVGEGKTNTENCVKLPVEFIIRSEDGSQPQLSALIDEIYGDLGRNYNNQNYFRDRVILTPKNSDVHAINHEVNRRLTSTEAQYLSVDSVEDEEQHQRGLYPLEFLNTLTITGMPPHKLALRVGAPIILLRNLHGDQGMCNGTRLRVIELRRNVIAAEILTGTHVGRKVFIPRITLISQNKTLPFQLRRRQFPVQLAYAMTINKAQGQSVDLVGLYLPQPVFTHGQLYVALSRVTSPHGIRILTQNHDKIEEDGVYTSNVVFREVIEN